MKKIEKESFMSDFTIGCIFWTGMFMIIIYLRT